MERVLTFTMRNLPLEVVKKKIIKPEYFFEKDFDTLPGFYKKDLGVYWDYDDFTQENGTTIRVLVDIHYATPVLKNEIKVKKGETAPIMGNTLHSAVFNGGGAAFIIKKIKDQLRDYFRKELKRIKPPKLKKFPLVVTMKFYMDLSNESMDEDGIRFFYDKLFKDCIQDTIWLEGTNGVRKKLVRTPNIHSIVPNDNIKYIVGSNFRVFHTTMEPYLIVNFYNYSNETEREMDFRNIEYEKAHPETGNIALYAEVLANDQIKRNPSVTFEDAYDTYFNMLIECQTQKEN